MAILTGTTQIFSGDTTNVDTIKQQKLGTRACDVNGREYIYLAGCTSTIVGSWVTYDEDFATTLLVTNAVGPVAVAQAITSTTSKYGWYCIYGETEACVITATADNAFLGFETTSGYAGDGCAAGDCITGAVSRESSGSTTGIYTVQICYPSVNDKSA